MFPSSSDNPIKTTHDWAVDWAAHTNLNIGYNTHCNHVIVLVYLTFTVLKGICFSPLISAQCRIQLNTNMMLDMQTKKMKLFLCSHPERMNFQWRTSQALEWWIIMSLHNACFFLRYLFDKARRLSLLQWIDTLRSEQCSVLCESLMFSVSVKYLKFKWFT